MFLFYFSFFFLPNSQGLTSAKETAFSVLSEGCKIVLLGVAMVHSVNLYLLQHQYTGSEMLSATFTHFTLTSLINTHHWEGIPDTDLTVIDQMFNLH